MEYKVLRFCILLFHFAEVIPTCQQDPYPNLCSYNGNDVSADDLADVEIKCDCQMVVFCSVISFVNECNSTTFQLRINESTTLLTPLTCNLMPLESQAPVPTLEVLNTTESELTVRFFGNSLLGKYKVFCIAPEMSDEFNNTVSNDWEIVDVNPAEIFVDSSVKLVLTVSKAVDSTPAWCFVTTPDNDTEILAIMDIVEDQVTCASFSPVVPGVFKVSLNYELPPYTFKKSMDVKVIGKKPVAQKAEYDSNFETILILFDANIKLQADCSESFPKIFLKYFGAGFDCYTRGNILVIKMGAQFKIIDNITINSNNKICREVDRRFELCISALPANLVVSKPKVSGPILSFYTTDVCTENKTQKYINLKVFDSNRGTVPFQNESQRPAGKTHRKNLMVWRSIRQFQSKLSSQLVVQFNRSDMLQLYENLSAFNVDLEADDNDNSLSSSATVSVHVQSSFANSPLWAEAHVEFCRGPVKLFRHKWLVNGRNVSEEGRLLTLSTLPPGKYLIKCVVVAYDSGEKLGQGWATTEVLENVKEVLIVPSEAVVGETDVISLRAVSLHSASWTCRTTAGKYCFRRNQNGDAYDFTSSSISLPAGSLPLGDYVWTVESAGETNTARVSVKPGNVAISVEIPTVFVNPSVGFTLSGKVIQKMEERCYAGWSSARQKGFNYLDLDNVGVKEIFAQEINISLAISLSSSTSQANSLYLFKLQVFCPQSATLRYIKVPLRMSAPPAALPVTVEPLTGKAMITDFKVSAAEADVSPRDSPLVYEWSYVDACDNEVPLQRGLSVRNFTTYFPPGDVKIRVRVCDGKRICSTSVSPTVRVIQPAEIHAENFEETFNQIRYFMASGDVGEALGLAVTVFKSLALTAEFEIRNKAFAVVEEVIILRIKHLMEKLRFDPNAVKLSLEFCEQTEMVAKYFRKGSALLARLMAFRKSLNNFSKSN